ncbi:MAG: hypothetical protein EA341_14270 [Mongoliibacter sp.]|nr:MAG: hypothetical protein EA341_14270 [Mongoliibacter sp.]
MQILYFSYKLRCILGNCSKKTFYIQVISYSNPNFWVSFGNTFYINMAFLKCIQVFSFLKEKDFW